MCPPNRSSNSNSNRPRPSEIKWWTEEPWKLKEAFNVLDKDGDGKIDLSDLQDFFTGSGFSVGKGLRREELEGMISVADADNSGSVDFDEFDRILLQMMPQIHDINETRSHTADAQMWPALKEAFNAMDRDGDGIVSEEDLKTFFSSISNASSSSESCNIVMMSDQDIADMIEAAGGPAKSGVCYEDFARLMMTIMNGSA